MSGWSRVSPVARNNAVTGWEEGVSYSLLPDFDILLDFILVV